jgi:hypothetical protein
VEEIDLFGVERIEGETPRSELLWQGRRIGVMVDGVRLEKQFEVGLRYLVFLTEDCPYEEGLHIYLLDAERRPLDGLELSFPYTMGILGAVQPQGETALTFSFFGGDCWRLQVRDRPKAGLNFDRLGLSLYTQIKRKGGLWIHRWLDLRRLD